MYLYYELKLVAYLDDFISIRIFSLFAPINPQIASVWLAEIMSNGVADDKWSEACLLYDSSISFLVDSMQTLNYIVDIHTLEMKSTCFSSSFLPNPN